MQTSIHLDLTKLKKNIDVLGELHPRGTRGLCVVLKSDAYGHGLIPSLQALTGLSIHSIGVAYLEEAEALRSAGYKGRILILTPVFQENFAKCAKEGFEFFISSPELFQKFGEFKRLLPSASRAPMIHLKFDTGLSRQGLLKSNISELRDEIISASSFIVGVCSHFANVEDVEEQDFAESQLKEFAAIRKILEPLVGAKTEWHIASSAAHILMPEARLDFARVGIAIYGIWPSKITRTSRAQIEPAKKLNLNPCMTIETKIHALKRIQKGSYVGYGCTFRAPKDMTLASLPVGYYEGFLRIAGQRGAYVLVDGCRCRIIGTISMNIMMIDVTDLPTAEAGTPVTLLGPSGTEKLTAEQWSEWAGTIPYEFCSRLHPAIPRKY